MSRNGQKLCGVLEHARVNDPDVYHRRVHAMAETALAPYIAFTPDAALSVAERPEAYDALSLAFQGTAQVRGGRAPAITVFNMRGDGSFLNCCYAPGQDDTVRLNNAEALRKTVTAMVMRRGGARKYTKHEARAASVLLPCDYTQEPERMDVGVIRTDFSFDTPDIKAIIEALCSANTLSVSDILLRFPSNM